MSRLRDLRKRIALILYSDAVDMAAVKFRRAIDAVPDLTPEQREAIKQALVIELQSPNLKEGK